jgi:glycine cleavage system H protein
MRMGLISDKICPSNYQCWSCEYDQRMEDLAETHPIFMRKREKALEKVNIDGFEIRLDRLYNEGHIWIKQINGAFRMGIDDFCRQIIGSISDMRLPTVNTVFDSNDVLMEISGNGKTLQIYAPFEGKVVDINPDILDNPSLASMAPYVRGWILTLEPVDILQVLNELLFGRSAKEWLKLDAHKFHEVIKKETETDLTLDTPIPKDFAITVSEDTWKKILKIFFVRKKKKKKVKLFRIEDIH